MTRWSYHLPILTYHRIGPSRPDHVPTVSAWAFERQMALLARFRYRVLSLDDVADCLDRGQALPRHSVAITFDDGYDGTHAAAWPILRRLGFPAAVFVAPAEIGRPGFSSWEQLADMAQDGMTVGSHTMHHAYLPLVPEARLTEELLGSKRAIEARLGRPVQYLSYPVGGFTPQAQAAARAAGYRAACTTNRACSRALDRYAIRRIKMTERDAHPAAFLAKVSGYYDLFRQLPQPS
jgi:peptidoglycan/xylan/chitin deacetylase (PgdA/CDA1 family)